VDSRLYNRLLIRLLALPVAALTVLALILAYGLQRIDRAAQLADHSDQIIAQANLLIKLMVDEETGIRGYLLVHNPLFLQPMREADQRFDAEMLKLSDMVRGRPEQVAKLQRLQASHEHWEQVTAQEIQSPPSDAEMDTNLSRRKNDMDDLRAQMDDFLRPEQSLRDNRIANVTQVNEVSRIILVGILAIIAAIIAWQTRKIFLQLTATFNEQIVEIKTRGDESYAREQWLTTTLRSIGDAVIACDNEGRISFMNLIAEQLTGWSEHEAAGHSLHDVFPIFNEETRAPVENPVDKVRRLGTIVGLANHTFLISKDGREICIDDSGAPICDSDGKIIGIVLVFRDISERRVSEAAMMRAEKLAAAGRLAASVAHEVNNPLEGLTNLVYIARRSDQMDEIRVLLTQAESELARIAHITRQSLGFYRETTIPLHFKPSLIVREVTDFYASRAERMGVSFVVSNTTDREVLGSPGELRQILSNLIANSLDACAPGATIRVSASSAIAPRNPSQGGVRITVGDTGEGIRPDHLPSIFEPFFTTKKETGTGLGLWVSRELVEKHGGSLRVRSNVTSPRTGTVFSIFLPTQGGPQVIASATTEQNHTSNQNGHSNV
jgi:PAS domain S-box-containing protein